MAPLLNDDKRHIAAVFGLNSLQSAEAVYGMKNRMLVSRFDPFDKVNCCVGIRRIALLDFDVHHGNGTQACVGRLVPQVVQYPISTPLCDGSLKFQSFHPWLDETDSQNIIFAR